MGIKNSKTKRTTKIKLTNELTQDDIFTIFLFTKTSSTGINMFETADVFRDLTKDELISSIKSIVYNPNEVAKISNIQQFQIRRDKLFLRHILQDIDYDDYREEKYSDDFEELKLPESFDKTSPISRTLTIHERNKPTTTNDSVKESEVLKFNL